MRTSVVFFVAFLFNVHAAVADDGNYQSFLVGGRALGLGGAFVSIADDPSGLFYNPAGIAAVTETNYQVSTNLYGFERGGIQEGQLRLPVPGVERLDVEFTDLIIVPAAAGYVETFGPKQPNGLRLHNYAITVLIPTFRSFQISDESTAQAQNSAIQTTQKSSYSRRVTDRSLWAGMGYAYKFSEKLHFGFSGFYILRTSSDIEDLTSSANFLGGNPEESPIFQTARNDVTFVNGNLLFLGGIKYFFHPRFTLGLSVQTPTLSLHSQSKLRVALGKSVPDCESLGLSEDACAADPLLNRPESNLLLKNLEGSSETKLPPVLRAGIHYNEPYRLTVSTSFSYHFPVSYELIRSPELDDDLKTRLPFNPSIRRQAVLNFNIGAEYLVVRKVSIAAGFFTDYSSSPRIPEEPTFDQPPRINLRGITMALGYFGKHTLSRLGLMYSWGEGKDVIPTSNVDRLLESTQKFQRVDYFQSFFYIFLSNTFRY